MNTPRSNEELADDYVLGLLDPAEHAEIERRAEVEPALRKAIAVSRDRFLELDLTATPVEASSALWSAVEARLEQNAASADDSAKPGSDRTVVEKGAAQPAANDNTRGWRLAAFVGAAASLLLAIGLGWSLNSRPAPLVVAVLLNEQGDPVALIEDFDGPDARVVALADFQAPDGRTFQLWTLPPGETRPVSLGIWGAGRTGVVRASLETPAREGQLYEISLEQAGGSPTGLPTGPILGKGFAATPR